ncbi:SirB1 family protein [Rhodoferax sp. BAB1]|uniref:SirB1 family protein n=1 Tax=Rhodoferax sp. BAB1 TaxID=2741720 RepID=UPI0015761FF7|nr:transglutaminase-like domain-containing protein [Rhodoferax sp. BAB1]QKO22241.1 tetratricopeptide repeat protein [Rhodoferax sp. BAB1]
MNLSFKLPTPLDYFGALVQSDAQFHLLEVAVCLGQDDYPRLDVQQVLAEVDVLLARLRQRLPADAPAMHKLRLLNHFFFHDLHFCGNLNHYHDPDNSYLHRVLERRCGIPVSLAVLWLELAQGLGLPAHGVGFPGHFLVKVNLPHAQVVIDPFSGQSLSREELQARLEAWRSSHALPGASELPLGHYLQAMPAREIIARMLRNLKEIHRTQQDWSRLVAVEDRLLVLLPQAWGEYRDRGLAQAELGQFGPAVRDLETYLGQAGQGEDAQAITERVVRLRRALG